jgi:predicted RNase H-like HicB family nuclease
MTEALWRTSPVVESRSDTDRHGNLSAAIMRELVDSRFAGKGVSELVEGLPLRLVESYADAATRHAVVREVDPGVWVASVVGLEGAWADGDSPEDALRNLPEAIVGWVAVKRRVGASDIPRIEGIDLNPRESE